MCAGQTWNLTTRKLTWVGYMSFSRRANAGYGKNNDGGDIEGDEEGVGYVPDSPEIDPTTKAKRAGDERLCFHVCDCFGFRQPRGTLG